MGRGIPAFASLFCLTALLSSPSKATTPAGTAAAPLAPAMFIFGDSLVDNGNNNFIPSVARANYLPYGIDVGSPTGRFCNGLTVVDYGASALGLPFPPPYLSLSSTHGRKLLQGANYASAAAGILDETGEHYGARVSFNGQIELFKTTVRTQLPVAMPDQAALTKHLARSVFVINIGSNDYINNYLLPNAYVSSHVYTSETFADLLIEKFSQQLKRLYQLGARKVVLVGIGPLGCIPSQLSAAANGNGNGSCVERVNTLVSAFNRRLLPLMETFNATLPGSFFVYQDIYTTFGDMVQNPSRYGFKVANAACCGSGRYGGTISCLPLQTPCRVRGQYIFWDSFHPTQAANAIIARRCYTDSGPDCHPISITELAKMRVSSS